MARLDHLAPNSHPTLLDEALNLRSRERRPLLRQELIQPLTAGRGAHGEKEVLAHRPLLSVCAYDPAVPFLRPSHKDKATPATISNPLATCACVTPAHNTVAVTPLRKYSMMMRAKE